MSRRSGLTGYARYVDEYNYAKSKQGGRMYDDMMSEIEWKECTRALKNDNPKLKDPTARLVYLQRYKYTREEIRGRKRAEWEARGQYQEFSVDWMDMLTAPQRRRAAASQLTEEDIAKAKKRAEKEAQRLYKMAEKEARTVRRQEQEFGAFIAGEPVGALTRSDLEKDPTLLDFIRKEQARFRKEGTKAGETWLIDGRTLAQTYFGSP